MECRQPDFVPDQTQYNCRAQPENLFLAKIGSNRYKATGVISDCYRTDRHYSRSYRLFRTLRYGEPFQLRKNGKNMYGTSASYTILRLMSQYGNESINVLCCGEGSYLAAGDEVTLWLTRTRNGEYILHGGENHTTNARICRDPLSVSPGVLRMIALISIMIIIVGLAWLANGGISQLISGALSLIGLLLAAIWRAFGAFILLVIGVILIVKSLLHR